ncbi:WD40/YVTN/BNR-like repeat-containing protein [Paraglaciecola hydrolytica]|nr:hypothetical protein [Paraglaciecola hydrolytica]
MLFTISLTACLSCVAGTVKVLDPNISFQTVHRLGTDIWASGTHGAIYHSKDNGLNWQKVKGPVNTEQLQFRDIHAFADGTVTIMSAGEGGDSRIYRRDNTTQNWSLQVQGEQPETFFDCLHFSDKQHGWLYGDSDKQGLFVLQTQDGGVHWQRQTLPLSAQTGEGGFASSGTCLNQGQNAQIYIGTGNTNGPRVLNYKDGEWHSIETPISGGEAAGIFSVQQADENLYIFGGSLKTENNAAQAFQYNLATREWLAMPVVPLKGAIYGSALLHVRGELKILIANPQGVAVLNQGQASWQILSDNNIWSLACDPEFACIGVGKEGVVELFSFR